MSELETDQTPESGVDDNYSILTTSRYKERISERQGVSLTETMFSGDDEGMRAQYVQRTERLIDRIRHGFKGEDGIDHENADVVFYLDKSARPVEWLTDSLWDVFKEGDGTTPEKPESKFINLHAHETPGGARPEIQAVEEMVRDGKLDQMIVEMRNVYPDLDGKNIMVVDEVSVSGATETLAYELFRKAFPEAHIKSSAWMSAGKRFDERGNSYPIEIPVWYSKLVDSGRGIDPINPTKSMSSTSQRQRLGANILSTAPEVPDLDAMQLRREIRQLAADVQTGRLPIIPDQDYDNASTRYAGMKIRQAHNQLPETSLFD